MDQLLEKNLITTKQASELSGYTPDYLSRLARSGKISGRRIGHSWLVERESLKSFVVHQGDHKTERARELARAREAEYRAHHSTIRRITRALTDELSTARESALAIRPNANHVGVGANSLRSHALALSVALLVVAAGAFGARAAALPRLAQAIAGLASEAAYGFEVAYGDIPLRIAAQIGKTGADRRALSHRIATDIATVSENLAQYSFVGANLSLPQIAPVEERRVLSRDASTAHPYPVAFAPTTIEDVIASVRDAYALVTTPSLAASSLAHMHAAFGTDAYTAINASFSAYRSLVERVGEGALALGATSRDALATTPRLINRINLALGEAIIAFAHSAIRADAAFAYWSADSAPASARAATMLVLRAGGALAGAASRAPALAAAFYLRATAAPAELAPRLARAVFGAEYEATASFLAFSHHATEQHLALVEGAGRLAYAGAERAETLALISTKLVSGLASARPALSGGERAALATYETVSGFMRAARGALASFFTPSAPPTIVMPSVPQRARVAVATSTPRVLNSYPTYTTVVQGVSQDSVARSLAALRADVLATAAALIRPVAAQTATNVTTIQQVNMIQDLSNLIVRNGDFRGGSLTNGALVSATTGTFTTNLTTGTLSVSGTATSTFSGNLSVAGNINFDGAFLQNGAPFVGSQWTTSGSNIYYSAGSVGIGTTSPYSLLSLSNNLNTAANTPLFTIASTTAGTATSTLLTVLASGNVGVGTASPAYPLHVAGQCVTADTRLRRRRHRKRGETDEILKQSKAYAWDDEYVYEGIEIVYIEKEDEIASMDQKTGRFVWSKVNGLLNMGIQPLIKIRTLSGREIRTTSAHPYFVRTGEYRNREAPKMQKLYRFEVDLSMKIENYASDTVIAVANSESVLTLKIPRQVKQTLRDALRRRNPREFLPAIYAAGIVEALRRVDASVHELKIDTDYLGHDDVIARIINTSFPDVHVLFAQVGKKSPAHFAAYGAHTGKKPTDHTVTLDEIKMRINAESALPVSFPAHKGAGSENHQTLPDIASIESRDALVKSGKWTAASELRVGQEIAVAHGGTPAWERIVEIKELPEERVYDIEIEGTHNFIGNDIVAHNTYIGGNLTVASAATIGSLSGVVGANSGALYAVASSSLSLGAGLSYSGTLGALVGGASGSLTIATSSLYSGTTGQFPYFSGTNTLTATSSIFLATSGNVGVGTASPSYPLHVAGQCVTADTRLRRRRRRSDGSYEYDEPFITDIREGDEIQSLDEKTGKLVWSRVKQLAFMGVKQTYRIATGDGRFIRTTANHPYLTDRGGWLKVSQIREGDHIAAPKPRLGVFIDDANMFYGQRKADMKLDWQAIYRELSERFEIVAMRYHMAMPRPSDKDAYEKSHAFKQKLPDCVSICEKPLKYIRPRDAKGNIRYDKKGDVDMEVAVDVWRHIEQVDAVALFAGDSDYAILRDEIIRRGKKIAFASFDRTIAWEIRAQAHLLLDSIAEENREKSKAPSTGLGVLLHALWYPIGSVLSSGRARGVDSGILWTSVRSVSPIAEEDVYDIEIEGTHNFIGNDIVAHNTYIGGNLTVASAATIGSLSGVVGANSGALYAVASSSLFGFTPTPFAWTPQTWGNATSTTTGFLNGLLSTASSTFTSNTYFPSGIWNSSGNVGIGTTSPGSLLSLGSLANFTTATSTFYGTGGLNLSAGCFAINGTCVGGGGGGSGTVGSGTTGQFPYYAANGTTLTATSSIFLATSGNVGIGTTGPGTQLTIQRPSLDSSIDNPGANAGLRIIRGGGGTDSIQLGVGLIGGAYQSWIQSSHDAGTKDLLIQPNGGNVGIGTTSPGYKLDVNGDMNLAAGSVYRINGVAQSGSSKWTAGTGDDIYRSLGNVGIGTTNPQVKLHIDAGSTAGAYPIYVQHTGSADGRHGVLDYLDQGSASTWVIEALNVNDAAATADFSITTRGVGFTNSAFVIKDSGNVGIGTTTPGSKLSVSDSVSVGANYGVAAPTNGMIIEGNLGIGTTNPRRPLEIATTGTVVPEIFITSLGAAVDGKIWRLSAHHAATPPSLRFDTITDAIDAVTNILVLTRTGNIGIGTAAPGEKLSVIAVAPANWATRIQNFGATSNSWGLLVNTDTNSSSILGFEVRNNTSRSDFVVTTAGNVGIGTTDPSAQKLVVAGNVRVGTGTTGCVEDADGTLLAGTCSSDLRLKENITPFSPVLDRLVALTPVTYNWRAAEFPERRLGTALQTGLVAQEVAAQFPELVSADDKGFEQIAFQYLPFYLLQGTKELYAKIQPLAAVLTVEPQVESQCVTSDTRLRRRKNAKGEYEYDEVDIKDIVAGDEIQSLEEAAGLVVYSRVNALIDMGEQEVYELITKSGRRIRTTSNHPFLARVVATKS